MTLRLIKTKKDYQNALNRLEVIFDAKPGTSQGDELEVLGNLIDKYEQDHYPITFPDPIEAIKFRMEQLGYSQSDLANVVGLKSRASVKLIPIKENDWGKECFLHDPSGILWHFGEFNK